MASSVSTLLVAGKNQAASPALPWGMLFGRTLLFIAVQAVFALGYSLAGSANAWEAGANWWPLVVTIGNLLCLTAMIRFFQSEGKTYWHIFRIQREHIKRDLLVMFGLMLITGPISYFPNILLGGWLFGSAEKTLELIVRPLPLWAVYISIVSFPLTQALVEIPAYFLYVMPRIQSQGISRWMGVALASVMLGLQHIAIPFLFDARFITWRAFMFIPFAFLVGITINWRPRLLPYLVVVHGLMDMAFAFMFLGSAY